ncbi:hypothetical protein [Salinicoccus halitifaciens]|uniref:Heat induced stress protein YflT n=1 Tax=Salinicoccus halitifaciens TaxID=1073415 RepID=A0ABV2ECD8_9STAP|nr:hypothetical protein [Salinicoccus halitifaciens]MCD2138761.1 hypothetical protein [Salinicoccus halitifaciens]
MGKIESFPSEALLIERIEKHLSEGVAEERMTVIANTDLKKVRSEYPGIRNESKDIGPWEKFLSIMAVKSREEKELDKLDDLTEHEKYVYRKALEDNEAVLYIGE